MRSSPVPGAPLEVAPDVSLRGGTYVNWVLVREGTDLTRS
jgi:hypothetical protein